MATLKIEVPPNTKAALVVFAGDGDGDGVPGITSKVLVDLPFDGDDDLEEVLSIEEFEPVQPATLGALAAEITKRAAPLVDAAAKLWASLPLG